MSMLFTNDINDILENAKCDMKAIVPISADDVRVALYFDCEPIAMCDGEPYGVIRMTIKHTAEDFVKALLDIFVNVMNDADSDAIEIASEEYIEEQNFTEYKQTIAGKLLDIAEEISIKCCEGDVFGDYNERLKQNGGQGLYAILCGVRA